MIDSGNETATPLKVYKCAPESGSTFVKVLLMSFFEGMLQEQRPLFSALPVSIAQLCELCQELPQFFSCLVAAVTFLRFGALVQQGRETPVFEHVSRGVMQETPRGATPGGESGEEVLTDSVVVVVHRDSRAEDVLGEGEAGFFVAFLVAALVPHVIVLWFIWFQKNIDISVKGCIIFAKIKHENKL